MSRVCLEKPPTSHYEERMRETADQAEGAKSHSEVIKLSKQLSSIYKEGLQTLPEAQKYLSKVFSSARRDLGHKLTHLALEKFKQLGS